MDEQEWEILLWDIARKAADERYKLHEDGFRPQDIAGVDKSTATEQFADEFANKLIDSLKYETLDDEDRRVIKNYPISKMTNWLMGSTVDNPMRKAYEVKFDKFASLLDDNVNSELDQPNWKTMDFVNDIEARNAAKELGYNLNKVEDRGEFFKKLAEFQTAYDRGIAADNMGESGWGKFNEYVHPSVWEEAQRQAITGEGTEADLKALGALDAGTNALMFGIPGFPSTHKAKNILSRFLNAGTRPIENGLNRIAMYGNNRFPVLAKLDDVLSNPVLSGAMDAGMQGTAETGRQIGKTIVDPDLEFNVAAPVTATTMGASRPALYASATGVLNSFQGPTMRNIAKGIMKSTRSGNPVEIERKAIEEAIDAYEKQLGKTGVDRSISTADVMARTKGVRARDILKAFEVKDETGRKINLLKKYDDEGSWKWDWDNDKMGLTPESQEKWDALKAVAGSKLADLGDATPDVKTGLLLGHALGEIGSRFEPTYKFNPFNPKTPASKPDYKESEWYQNMDPEKRDALEKAIAELAKNKRK